MTRHDIKWRNRILHNAYDNLMFFDEIEVRQHQWFLHKLPAYLALPPEMIELQERHMDQEIVLKGIATDIILVLILIPYSEVTKLCPSLLTPAPSHLDILLTWRRISFHVTTRKVTSCSLILTASILTERFHPNSSKFDILKHTNTYVYIHSWIQTCTHIHTHTHKCARTHTRTHVLQWVVEVRSTNLISAVRVHYAKWTCTINCFYPPLHLISHLCAL